jgi:hypothetical protein
MPQQLHRLHALVEALVGPAGLAATGSSQCSGCRITWSAPFPQVAARERMTDVPPTSSSASTTSYRILKISAVDIVMVPHTAYPFFSVLITRKMIATIQEFSSWESATLRPSCKLASLSRRPFIGCGVGRAGSTIDTRGAGDDAVEMLDSARGRFIRLSVTHKFGDDTVLCPRHAHHLSAQIRKRGGVRGEPRCAPRPH